MKRRLRQDEKCETGLSFQRDSLIANAHSMTYYIDVA